MSEKRVSKKDLKKYSEKLKINANILKRNFAYTIDQTVNKGQVVLKCTTAGTTDKEALNLSSVSVGDTLTDGTAEWEVTSITGYGSGSGGGGTTIADWTANTAYEVDDLVIYNNSLYQCLVDHTSTSTFDPSKWQVIGNYITAPIKVGEVGWVSWQYTLMQNHLALDGSTVSNFQATYPELYDFFDTNSLITTVQADYDANHALLLYDSVNDEATMPNFLDKTVWGGNTVVEKEAGLPNITGGVDFYFGNFINHTGAITTRSLRGKNAFQGGSLVSQSINVYEGMAFDASNSNSIYGNSTTVQPPAIGLIPQIRYAKDTVEGVVSNILGWETAIGYSVGDFVIYDNQIYRANTAHTSTTFSADIANWDMISGLQVWTASTTYKANSLVYYGGKLYKVTTDFTSTSTFETTNLELVGGGLSEWEASTSYNQNDIIVYDGEIYKVLIPFVSDSTAGSIAEVNGITPTTWTANTSYTAGDIIEHQNVYYEVTDNFTSGALFEVTAEMDELQIVEEFVPKPLTEADIDELVNAFNPSGRGTNPVLYNDTPIGTIISYMGLTPPRDYLACDGQTYSISSYNELAEYIKLQFGSYNYFGGDGITTFAVPDLRGEFLRGTGTNSHTNQGSGANVGTHQDATSILNTIMHTNGKLYLKRETSTSNNTISNQDYSLETTSSTPSSSEFTPSAIYNDGSKQIMHVSTRPTNTSVLYCIKYNTTVLSTPENNYSTEEKKIGTWIDGKPLYQKTYDVGTLPNNTSKYIQLDMPIDKIISMEGFAITTDNSGYITAIPRVRPDNLNLQVGVVYTGYTQNKLNIFTNSDNSALYGYITIKYTKTTD